MSGLLHLVNKEKFIPSSRVVGTVWPQALTPAVNIISGFKKCGIYPLNQGEVTDRQVAPSTLFTNDPSPSAAPDVSSFTSPDLFSICNFARCLVCRKVRCQ